MAKEEKCGIRPNNSEELVRILLCTQSSFSSVLSQIKFQRGNRVNLPNTRIGAVNSRNQEKVGSTWSGGVGGDDGAWREAGEGGPPMMEGAPPWLERRPTRAMMARAIATHRRPLTLRITSRHHTLLQLIPIRHLLRSTVVAIISRSFDALVFLLNTPVLRI